MQIVVNFQKKCIELDKQQEFMSHYSVLVRYA